MTKIYKEAHKLWETISGAQKIATSLHVSPDTDSIGSNLALWQVLNELGKEIDIFSPDPIPLRDSFLPGAKFIKERDIKNVDFSKYDLLICLDAQDPQRLTSTTDILNISCPVAIIDHHIVFADTPANGVVDPEIGSTAELLFLLFKQWKIEIPKDTATDLLAGMVGDTGTFRYEKATTSQTFLVASALLESGANLGEIMLNMYQRIPLASLKFWAKVWGMMEVKEIAGKKMVFAALQNNFYTQFFPRVSDEMPSTFLNSIEETDFGLILKEENKGEIIGSLRSRTQVDVSQIAKALGGGGHKSAAGFRFIIAKRQTFDDAVKQIHEVIAEVLDGTR